MTAADSRDAVAVVAMAIRLPGASSADIFWRNLVDGVESVTRFSDEELRAAGVDEALLRNPRYVKARPVLDGFDLFDAPLFGMAAREAERTDPQQRLLLELCHEALERAACAPEQFAGTIGIFAGTSPSAYLLHNLAGAAADGGMHAVGAHLGIGNAQDFVATRIAYKLNLTGPAFTVQSACSTSLVAVHLACQHLLGYECDLALAGGASLGLPMRSGYLYQEDGMVSPDGHCRPFDAAARGTVFGSGGGIVVLKRLDDAIAAGDAIQAVVIGSAVNNDGAAKAGFTAPSVTGQASVVAEAIANAGVDVERFGCVEAHGTATPIGDPIEIEALTRAFRAQTASRQFCAIGSVKSNLGHLDAAAGVAGFVKAVLAIRHGTIPPTLHFERPNPRIDFAATPFFVNAQARPWPEGTRYAGVSAFGIGGTNAHVVLQQAPATMAPGPARRWHVLPLSARTSSALEQATTDLADFLDDHPETPIADAAFTLQVGRRAGEHRRATVVEDGDEAIDRLLELPPRDVFTASRGSRARPLVFMFPGQGAQHDGMGRDLAREEPAFARELERCRALLGTRDAEQSELFAVEYALARLWQSWGLEPESVIGMSVGECTAAVVAGVLTLEDACRLVAARARLAAGLPPGAMLAVPMAPEELRPLLDGEVSLALVNTPTACVAAGAASAIAALEARLTTRGVTPRRLETVAAYHSPLVRERLEECRQVIAGLTFRAPRIPLVSGSTGRAITEAEATSADFWIRQLAEPVYFSEGIRELLKDPARAFLEVGPAQTLTALARQNAERGRAPTAVASLPDPRERRPETQAVHTALARLWTVGLDVNWGAYHDGERRCRITLPTYPFERQRYWVEPSAAQGRAAASSGVERIGRVDDWFSVPAWTTRPLVRSAAAARRRVLLLAGADPLSRALADRLRARHDLVVVVAGRGFERIDDRTFAIDPAAADDYGQLLEALGAFQPDLAVHAWTGDVAADDTAASLDRGFHSILGLGRALGRRAGVPAAIALVTPAVHVVDGRERPQPLLAAALGPLIVLGQEHPHLSGRHLEVSGDADEIAASLVDDVDHGDAEPRVAWRGRIRWVQRIERISLPAPVAAPMRLKTGGVYVVTGGLGGVGLTLAAYLARECRAKLALVSRSPMPPRDTWAQRRNAAPDDPVAARVRAIEAMEAAGAIVMTVAADVTSVEAMRALAGTVRAAWGRVDGIVHAAGVAGGGLIAVKTREQAERVLAPKVQGTIALERAFADAPLDFFVACSSLAAIAGGVGQADYCGANAFLDAWAAARRAGKFPATAIDWDAWQQVGMATNTAVPEAWREHRDAQLTLALTPDEGADVFRRVLDQDYAQVAVCTVGLAARLRAPAAQPATERARHPRPPLPTEFVPPASEIERRLAAVWEDVLGVDGVGVLDNFFDLGGDSLTALGAVDALRDVHGIDLAITNFYAAPTIRLLAAQLSVNEPI